MAMYRLEVQGIRRADGRSSVAAAAYRAGAALWDSRLEMAFDYRGRGGVEHTEIMAPEAAPASLRERDALWNAAEAADTRSDSRPAREVLLALPHELDLPQRVALVRQFVEEQIVARGMVADVALHAPDKHGDQRNHHAHILVTTREVGPQGFGRKVVDWTRPQLIREWRQGWEAIQNRHLQIALGPAAPQISAKSLAEQGIDRDPTIHLGPAASAMERRGDASDRGDVNRRVHAEARERAALRREIERTEDDLVARAPHAPKGAQALARELGVLHRDLIAERVRLEGERDALPPPPVADRRAAYRELLEPALRERRSAATRLAATQARVEGGRALRAGLHRWISRPARMIWAKHAELNALGRAKAELRRSEDQLRGRRAWIRSESGQVAIAARVEPVEIAAAAARTARRTLERRIRRVSKRARDVEAVRTKVLIAEALGHHTLSAPTRTFGTTQLVRAVDRLAVDAMSGHSREAQRQALDKVRGRERGRSQAAPFFPLR